MKRGSIVIFLFAIVLLLSISLVSASWFSDFWNKITGRVVGDFCSYSKPCPNPGIEGCDYSINKCVLCSYFCNPTTGNKKCGDYSNGCICGGCPPGQTCNSANDGKCVYSCTPNNNVCLNKNCGGK